MKDLSKLSANQIFSIDTRGKPMTKTTFYNQITKNINIGNNLTNIASIGFYKAGQLLVKAKKELKGEFGKLKKELAQSGLHIKQQERYMAIAKNENISLNYSKMPPQWTFWEKVAMLPPETFNKIVHLIHKGAKWKDIELFLGKHIKLGNGNRSKVNERDNRTEIFGLEYLFEKATKKDKSDFIKFEKEVKKLASKYKFIKLKKKNYFDDAISILDEDRSKTKDDTTKEDVKTKMKSYNPKRKINL
jgi:hypothetical protein